MSKFNLILKFWEKVAKEDAKRIASLECAADVEEIRDVPYLNDGDKMHLLDVYRPKNSEGKLPVIFDIHGGGWYYGDKDLNRNYCMSLVKYGFAVVAPSYRLAPYADIFAQVKDCFAALNYIYDNAEKFGLDVSNSFVTGDSAGGHLTGLIVNILSNAELKNKFGVDTPLKPRAVCFTCPALEVGEMASSHAIMKLYFNSILGKGYKKNGVRELVSFSKFAPDNICPCYFISAYDDGFKEATKAGCELVKSKGADAEICFFDEPLVEGHKLDHVFNIKFPDWKESVEANKGMCEFFKKHLVY